MVASLLEVPRLAKSVLDRDEEIRALADRVSRARDVLYLGRGNCFPIALEGALKLKEISYIHAEGYAAGEMKHGLNFKNVFHAERRYKPDQNAEDSTQKHVDAKRGANRPLYRGQIVLSPVSGDIFHGGIAKAGAEDAHAAENSAHQHPDAVLLQAEFVHQEGCGQKH